jgi:hypothetical protein
MTISGVRKRRQGPAFGFVVRTVLSVALVVPATVLFTLVWQAAGEQTSFASLERQGVEYLQTLGPLEISLTNAQSAAVAGKQVPRDQLTRALDRMSSVDDRIGGALRTHERWAELRTKIEALPGAGVKPATAYTAYGETTDLLLALTDKVRNNSKLIRDPSADTYYLEDGGAQELPEGIVAAGQFADLAVLAAGQTAADQTASLADLTTARDSLASNAHDLSDDIRLAVDATDSPNIGASLLSKLDRFNRAIDGFLPSTALAQGRTLTIDTGRITQAQGEVQQAAADLSTALLGQIDLLLHDRLGGLNQRRALAVGTLAVALLLAVAPALLPLLRRRRPAGRDRSAPVAPQPAPTPAGHAPLHTTPEPSGWREPAPAGPPQWPTATEAPEGEYARWERFGASR